MRRRSAQIVVAAVLVIGLVLMSILVTVYQAHSLFLRTRSPVVRELVAAITADFKRALAVTLAVATRAYFNCSEFSDLTKRFSEYGILNMCSSYNFTIARIAAKTYLEYWRQSVTKEYAEYGVQLSYEILCLDLSKELNRSRSICDLLKSYWYLPTSGSYAYARLKLNVTNLGFYNWESDVFVGLTLTVYRKPVQATSQNTTIIINVRYDGDIDYSINPPGVTGNPYGRLLSKGWVRVYYPEKDSQGRYTGKWKLANITDVTYQGYGNYSVTFEPAVALFKDTLTGDQYVPVMVVVSDERGILVEGSTYYYTINSTSWPPPPYMPKKQLVVSDSKIQWRDDLDAGSSAFSSIAYLQGYMLGNIWHQPYNFEYISQEHTSLTEYFYSINVPVLSRSGIQLRAFASLETASKFLKMQKRGTKSNAC